MRTHLDIHHEGSLGTENRTRMTFDENSIAHLMSVLTDLYSDHELAVIREYSTNAWDSHRAAGNPDPIEITLPSSLNPTFTVTDHGVGMSVDEIVQHFSKYGWSSKRDNDDEVGMLGLGCKSGLTYTSQFTFISVHNGVRAVVLVTREEDGTGAIQIIDTTGTHEPNGVEVQVPVRNPVTFNDKATFFFQFWDSGSVLINGEFPIPIWESRDSLILDPDVVLAPRDKLRESSYLVMGNVAYPVKYDWRTEQKYKLVAANSLRAAVRVPIGTINFTPSREDLQYTKRTEDTIATARTFIQHVLDKRAQEEINQAPDHPTALKVAESWRQAYGGRFRRFTYSYKEIPNRFSVDDNVMRWTRPHQGRAFDACSRAKSISLDEADRALFVEGHRGMAVTATTKERLMMWVEENDVSERLVFFTDQPIGLPWLEDRPRVHIDDLRKIEVAKPAVPAGTTDGKYRILNSHGEIHRTDKLTTDVVWLGTYEKNVPRDDLARAVTRDLQNNDICVVLLGKPQVDKFCKANPRAIEAKKWVAGQLDLFIKNLTPPQAYHLSDTSDMTNSRVTALDKYIDKLLDPELQEAIRLARAADDGPVNEWNRLRRLANGFGIPVPDLPSSDLGAKFRAMRERYPLLAAAPRSRYDYQYGDIKIEAVIEYVNLVYETTHYFQPDTLGACIYR